jgi:CheY-like chemotaxis protein
MPKGGSLEISASNATITEDSSLLRPGDYVNVTIADTGIGIQQKDLQRIFDPFFTTKQHGTGLGLATCYSIIQKHDGHIDVDSVPGEGTTFSIYLPASTGHQKRPSGTTEVSKIEHSGGTVLIMDDEDFIRKIVGEMLGMMGYTGITVEDGQEAIEACKNLQEQGTEISGIILDLTIPGGMGGREAIREIRKSHPDTPIFASSGYSEDPVMADPEQFGFTGSIPKPYRKSDLAKLLAEHLTG